MPNPILPLWEYIPDAEPRVFGNRIYLYGSHDRPASTEFCDHKLKVWSADVNDLNNWHCHGDSFRTADGTDRKADTSEWTNNLLFAPDVVEKDGKYYLYTYIVGAEGAVSVSDKPEGPFKLIGRYDHKGKQVGDDGIFNDPGVLVDDDGRVYGYWGFETSNGAELDPTTMATVKPGTDIVRDMVSGKNQPGKFRFFEASSIRKIEDKYVFIYSRWTENGEFGLPDTNYTLAYAYSDHPLGPWTYGGTIIDGRGREVNEQGDTIASATVSGNTHGSICEINNQWYVFYHRQSGTNEFARQAMVAPIDVKVEKGEGGKVTIVEGEYNSCGFSLEGLDPLERHSAGIACWYTGPKVAEHVWPDNKFYGSYIASSYGTDDKMEAPYALRNNTNLVVNNTDGSIVGYKYFNFASAEKKNPKLLLRLIPEGIDGTIQVMADRPWTSQNGQLLGSIELKADMPKASTELTADLPALAPLTGRHAIYFVFASDTKEKSLCTLEDFVFEY